MHPWMLELVADQHRRDLLDQARRWRILRDARSSRTVQAGSSGRFRFGRRRQPIPSLAPAGPTPPSATATYAC
jgi:hypothetical protein